MKLLRCSICQEHKPHIEFHKNNASKSGRDSRCVSCKKKKRDAERQTPEYRAFASIQAAIWAQQNQDRCVIYRHVRRVKSSQQIAPWTRNNKEELKAIANLYKMAKDLKEAYGFEFHVDHIVPLNSKFVSGLTCVSNMDVLEKSANISKGNRTWPDMPDRLDYDELLRDYEVALAKKALKYIGLDLDLSQDMLDQEIAYIG